MTAAFNKSLRDSSRQCMPARSLLIATSPVSRSLQGLSYTRSFPCAMTSPERDAIGSQLAAPSRRRQAAGRSPMASQYAGLKSPPARKREIPSRAAASSRRAGLQAAAFEAITYTPPPWKKLKRFLLRGLTTKERLIITLKYCERLTFAEIGVVLALPEKQVAALHRDIVRRVRRWVLSDDYDSWT